MFSENLGRRVQRLPSFQVGIPSHGLTNLHPSHHLLLITKSPDSVKMETSHDSYGTGDSLPSPWPNLSGLLFFPNTNKLLSNIKANKRMVVPRSSPFLLKNLGTKGSVPMTGTPLLGLTGVGGSWVHTCQPTKTWTRGMRSIFSSNLDQNRPGWSTHQKKKQIFLDL